MVGWEVWATRAVGRDRPKTRSARKDFLIECPDENPPTGPDKLRSRSTATHLHRWVYLGPGKTSQLRICASILAQGFFAFTMFNYHKVMASQRFSTIALWAVVACVVGLCGGVPAFSQE